PSARPSGWAGRPVSRSTGVEHEPRRHLIEQGVPGSEVAPTEVHAAPGTEREPRGGQDVGPRDELELHRYAERPGSASAQAGRDGAAARVAPQIGRDHQLAAAELDHAPPPGL